MSELVQADNVHDLVKMQEPFFKSVMANSETSITWAKESQFAIQQLQKNNYLFQAALNNQASLQNAIINVAAIDISLNPANKHAYLVPRKPDKDSPMEVCLDISYMGLLHLAMKEGAIEWGQAKIVYSNDNYVNNGIDLAPTHQQQTFGDKGDIVGAYCTVKLPNGDYLTEEMDVKAINNVKATSKAQNGPWKSFYEEMARKTVVKRASKYWPTSPAVNTAIQVINEHEGIIDHESYSELEKQELDNLIQEGACFSMAAFMATRDEETQVSLYNSFPKGKITENKKIVNELCKEGHLIWQPFVEEVKDYIKSNDVLSLKAEILDFKSYEKKHLCNLLGEKQNELIKLLENSDE